MGIAVHYRGRLKDPGRLEPLEDRILDLALALGGKVRIWRSASRIDRTRLVKGVIWELAPGCETFPLLFSPEGWLVPLYAIEDAEEGRLEEQPWVSIKTQFAKPEAHIALIETLAAIRERYVSDLEVQDEGGYWESRDLAELLRKRRALEKAMEVFAKALEQARPHPHAKDDAGILSATLERIAEQVHKTLQGPSEHPPAFAGDENPWSDDPGTEAEWDAFYAEHCRKQERLNRHIEDALARGEDHEQAFENALEAEVIGPMEFAGENDEGENGDEGDESPFSCESEPEEPEPWASGSSCRAEADEDERHPLQEEAREMLLDVMGMMREGGGGFSDPLLDVQSGLMDVSGGLAQALLRHGQEFGPVEAGWNLVQLKRAMRGAAFAQGALFRARGEGRLDAEKFGDLSDVLDRLQADIFIEIGKARSWLKGA